MHKYNSLVNIIIPTFNNPDYLFHTVASVVENTIYPYRFKIVNNGNPGVEKIIQVEVAGDGPKSEILEPGRNLGWCGGINYAKDHLDEECKYVLLLNDDIEVLPGDFEWLGKLVKILDRNPSVGAVGPSSNVVMGLQSIRMKGLPLILEPKFLIGFCVLIRREVLDNIGWLDESLPGGDDIDWSISIRKLGYKLIARRDVYINHYGFKTGERVHGNYWNSLEMQTSTNIVLIRKHGFIHFVDTMLNQWEPFDFLHTQYGEHGVLNDMVEGKTLEVGCGSNKISPDVIGIDLVPKGCNVKLGDGTKTISNADIIGSGDDLNMFADRELDCILSRHAFEHFINPIKLLREWNRVLRIGGKVGITMPDGGAVDTMMLDATHMHRFDREAVKDLLESTGFRVIEMGGCDNQFDFYVKAAKERDL